MSDPTAPWMPRTTQVPMAASFRFDQRAVSGSGLVGREALLRTFVERLRYSHGGAMLVTGYRGVGKTTFVQAAMEELRESLLADKGQPADLVWVSLNVARPITPAELMHGLVRQLDSELTASGLRDRLEPQIQQLSTAVLRTSFNVERAFGTERETRVGLGGLPWGDWFGVEASKSSASIETLGFLGYDDRAAELDLIRLSRALLAGTPRRGMGQMLRRLTGQPAARRGLRLVFVFDELDKLEEHERRVNPEARSSVDELIDVLKNLFTTAGVSFVFVAGKDMYDRWLADRRRGDSVYESVFSSALYLPCVWEAPQLLLDQLLEVPREGFAGMSCAQPGCGLRGQEVPVCPQCGKAAGEASVVEELPAFLAFEGRGIARRINRALDELVAFHDGQPFLRIPPATRRWVTMCRAVEDALAAGLSAASVDVAGRELSDLGDRRRLAAYYLIDAILFRGAERISDADLRAVAEGLHPRIAPESDQLDSLVDSLIDALLDGGILEPWQASAMDRQLEATPGRQYRLAARWRGLAQESPPPPLPDPVPSPASGLPERFEVRELLAMGGMGQVYVAMDRETRREVAVKTLLPGRRSDRSVRARFAREARHLGMVEHPNIVKLIAADPDASEPWIAMERVEGLELQRIAAAGPSLPGMVSRLILDVASAVDTLLAQGIHRLDLKPGNLVLSPTGRVVLIDLGIARREDDATITQVEAIIGTLAYMAPEIVMRGGPVDPASAELWSLAAVAWELLTGVPHRRGSDVATLMRQVGGDPLEDRDEELAHLSPHIIRQLANGLSPDPASRPDSVGAWAQGLADAAPPASDRELAAWALQLERTIRDQSRRREANTAFFELGNQAPSLPPPPSANPAPEHQISVLCSNGPEGTYWTAFFDAGISRIRFGRAEDNDLQLDTPEASRYHGAFVARGDTWVVEDYGSANGTLVDGQRVAKEAAISRMSTVNVGRTSMTLRWSAAAAEYMEAPTERLPR